MIKKLEKKRYIIHQPWAGVTLTTEGKKIGESVKGRHDALLSLLKILDVPDNIADKDACEMEHNLHPITVIQIKKFIEFVGNCNEKEAPWLFHFIEYSRSGKLPLSCRQNKP